MLVWLHATAHTQHNSLIWYAGVASSCRTTLYCASTIASSGLIAATVYFLTDSLYIDFAKYGYNGAAAVFVNYDKRDVISTLSCFNHRNTAIFPLLIFTDVMLCHGDFISPDSDDKYIGRQHT